LDVRGEITVQIHVKQLCIKVEVSMVSETPAASASTAVDVIDSGTGAA